MEIASASPWDRVPDEIMLLIGREVLDSEPVGTRSGYESDSEAQLDYIRLTSISTRFHRLFSDASRHFGRDQVHVADDVQAERLLDAIEDGRPTPYKLTIIADSTPRARGAVDELLIACAPTLVQLVLLPRPHSDDDFHRDYPGRSTWHAMQHMPLLQIFTLDTFGLGQPSHPPCVRASVLIE
ncbi:hypothetical protein RQP46_008153 [Phenoliferia psychrophenolica]